MMNSEPIKNLIDFKDAIKELIRVGVGCIICKITKHRWVWDGGLTTIKGRGWKREEC